VHALYTIVYSNLLKAQGGAALYFIYACSNPMRENLFPDYKPPDNVRVLYKTGATFDSDVICNY
jgi:hypothetical protein